MCTKKEYKCYKGKADEECCNARVREALRNRTHSFVLILGIALMIISLVIKTSNNTEFVNQVSFASTITSIILSVIAIWMSITGERSTNEIKTKVTDSVNSIQTISSKTEELVKWFIGYVSKQNESGNLVIELKDMLSKQNESYNNIKGQIEVAISEIGGVKSTVISMKDSFMGSNQNIKNIPDGICIFFQNIVNGISNKNTRRYLCKILIMIFEKMEDDPNVDMLNICLSDKTDLEVYNKCVTYGIVMALSHNGFFKNAENCKYVKNEISKINK